MVEQQNSTPSIVRRRWVRGADGHWRRIWVVPTAQPSVATPSTPEPDKHVA